MTVYAVMGFSWYDAPSTMAAENLQKIVFDTDCGIDDAIALLLALSSKDKAEVIAVTCCFGNTSLDNVCSNVMRVLTLCDEKEIPVYRGCSGPIIKRKYPIATVHGSDGFGEVSKEFSTGGMKEKEVPAPLALVNLAKKYPQQITLIAVGPLTNLAIAHRIDPHFTENLKSIAIMGGNYRGIGNVSEVAEFNFYCDPDSADIILSEAACPVLLVPWETTREFGIAWDVYNELVKINTTKGHFFQRLTDEESKRRLRKGQKELVDCDFLAVVAALYPECVKSTLKSLLRVECTGELTTGLTILQKDSPSTGDRRKINIITGFDMEYLNSIRRKMLAE